MGVCEPVGGLVDSPIIQMGFRMNRNRPQTPMYLERQPADHKRTRYSTPKNTTKQISIQKSVSFAKSLYWSMVDSTLNIRQTRTSMKLRGQGGGVGKGQGIKKRSINFHVSISSEGSELQFDRVYAALQEYREVRGSLGNPHDRNLHREMIHKAHPSPGMLEEHI